MVSRGPIPDFPANRPCVPEVLEKARAYHRKEGNEVFGVLHVVLEDGNLGRDFIESALQRAEDRGDADGAELARDLLRMTPTQRSRVYRGCWR